MAKKKKSLLNKARPHSSTIIAAAALLSVIGIYLIVTASADPGDAKPLRWWHRRSPGIRVLNAQASLGKYPMPDGTERYGENGGGEGFPQNHWTWFGPYTSIKAGEYVACAQIADRAKITPDTIENSQIELDVLVSGDRKAHRPMQQISTIYRTNRAQLTGLPFCTQPFILTNNGHDLEIRVKIGDKPKHGNIDILYTAIFDARDPARLDPIRN